MPLARIVRSALARRDIGDIYQHVAREAGLEVADMVLTRITEVLHRAAERPFAYRRRTELRGGPRRINVFRYSIFFEELPESSGDLGGGIMSGACSIALATFGVSFSAMWWIDSPPLRRPPPHVDSPAAPPIFPLVLHDWRLRWVDHRGVWGASPRAWA